MKRLLHRLLPFVCLSLALAPVAAQDVAQIELFKGAWFQQNSAEDPVPIPAVQEPYDITAVAYLSDAALSDPDWPFYFTASFRTPGGLTKPMMLDEGAGAFSFYEGAASSSFINNRYSAGDYQFTINNTFTGAAKYNVPMALEDYPPAPRIMNFAAAQTVDATKNFALRWTNFTGGGEREIWLDIVEAGSGNSVFSEEALDGNTTSTVIPANTLQAVGDYEIRLTFTRYTHVQNGTVPATYSGFDSYNSAPLKTRQGGGPLDPPVITGWRLLANGDLELTVACTTGHALTVQGEPALGSTWKPLQTSTPSATPAKLVVPKSSLVPQQFLRVYQE